MVTMVGGIGGGGNFDINYEAFSLLMIFSAVMSRVLSRSP
jgi:hypothetical protein